MNELITNIENYLDDHLTAAERAAFENLLASEPNLQQRLLQVKAIREALEVSVEDDLREHLKDLSQKTTKKPEQKQANRSTVRILYAVAASLIILLGLFLWFFLASSNRTINEFVAANYVAYDINNVRSEQSDNVYLEGHRLMAADEKSGAILWFEQWTDAKASDWEAHFILAELQGQTGDWESALDSYLAIINGKSILWAERSTWNYLLMSAQYRWDVRADKLLDHVIADKNHAYHKQSLILEQLVR